MKNKALIIAILLSVFSLSTFAKVDCSDPKNRPRLVAGMLIGGKKECYRNLNAETAKRDLDLTIGRNPVTGKVTSKAELAGGDKATNNLEAAQQNFGKAKTELEEAEELYKSNSSTKYSNRLDKARKAFKKAQLDLEAAEEIKEKADRKKDK
jgi:putative lipoprotein